MDGHSSAPDISILTQLYYTGPDHRTSVTIHRSYHRSLITGQNKWCLIAIGLDFFFFGMIFFSEQCLTLITDHMDSTIFRSLTGNVTGHIMTGPFTGLQLPVIDRSGSVTTYQLPVFHCVFIGQFLVSRVSSTLHSCIPLAMIVLNTIFFMDSTIYMTFCVFQYWCSTGDGYQIMLYLLFVC